MSREFSDVESLLERDAQGAVEEALRRVLELRPLSLTEAEKMVRRVGRVDRCLKKILKAVVPNAEVTFSMPEWVHINHPEGAYQRQGVYVKLNGEVQGFLCRGRDTGTYVMYTDLTVSGDVAIGSAYLRTGHQDLDTAQGAVEGVLVERA